MGEERRPELDLRRQLGDRILLGCLAPAVALVVGTGLYAILAWHPQGLGSRVVRLIVLEGVFAAFALCILGFVWAIAAPKPLEQVIRGHALKVTVFALVFLVGLFLLLLLLPFLPT